MREKDKEIIEKILKYCTQIEKIIDEFKEKNIKYIENTIFQLSTDMCIFQIGELSIHVSDNFKIEHTDVPWAEMRGMRNIHAHEYDNVDREKMFRTLIEDIPNLKKKLESIV